MTTNK